MTLLSNRQSLKKPHNTWETCACLLKPLIFLLIDIASLFILFIIHSILKSPLFFILMNISLWRTFTVTTISKCKFHAFFNDCNNLRIYLTAIIRIYLIKRRENLFWLSLFPYVGKQKIFPSRLYVVGFVYGLFAFFNFLNK